MDILTLVLAKKMIENLQFKTINGEDILGEGNIEIIEATDEQIISWLNAESIVTPTISALGEIYTTNNNEIYIL